MRVLLLPGFLAVLCACTSSPRVNESPPAEIPTALIEVFDHVRLNRAGRFVEFDGVIMWEFHDPRTPDTYLEQIVCTPDTKEHESLVVSLARPSAVHAALLLIGARPGRPGSWVFRDGRLASDPPSGDPLIVRFVTPDGIEHDPLAWVVSSDRSRTLRSVVGDAPAFVFGGSRFVNYNGQDVYDADFAGTLVGLTTFGGETISFREVISHEAAIQTPEWLADGDAVPDVGEPIVVRVYLAAEPGA